MDGLDLDWCDDGDQLSVACVAKMRQFDDMAQHKCGHKIFIVHMYRVSSELH